MKVQIKDGVSFECENDFLLRSALEQGKDQGERDDPLAHHSLVDSACGLSDHELSHVGGQRSK